MSPLLDFVYDLARLLRLSSRWFPAVRGHGTLSGEGTANAYTFNWVAEPDPKSAARADRVRRATELSELSGVRWARCYADLLDADMRLEDQFRRAFAGAFPSFRSKTP